MSRTVGELLTSTLAEVGATQVFGVVGDALNAFTDAIRRDGRMTWMGVRHEEGAALAATGQAKLTGRLGVCAGTTGPGATHLLAGLYEAAHDHAPVLAISGDVPTAKGGIDYLQWADHVQTFRDACVYAGAVTSPDAAAAQIHEAIATAYARRGVALLNIPQDIFAAKTSRAAFSLATLRPPPEIIPAEADLDAAAQIIDAAGSVALFVGYGARAAKDGISPSPTGWKGCADHPHLPRPGPLRVRRPARRRRSRADRLQGRLRRCARLRRLRHDRQRLSLRRISAA